jgi:hypothetical protein
VAPCAGMGRKKIEVLHLPLNSVGDGAAGGAVPTVERKWP